MAEVTETARQRVQRMVVNWDWPDPAILEDIIALGEDAVPAMEELLTPKLLKKSHTQQREDSVVFYCIVALSVIRGPAALLFLIRIFAQADDDLLDVLPDAVSAFGPAAIDPLLTLVTDDTLGRYPRALSAEVAAGLAGDDTAASQRIADRIRPIVADYLFRYEALDEKERDTLSALAGELVDLTDAQARPMLEQALAEGKFDNEEFDQKYLEETYCGDQERYVPPVRDLLEQYREDYRRQQEQQENEAHLAIFEPETGLQPIVLSPKIGRNDPCWCGSGQKYKRCHLAQDEKERVRL